MRLLRKVHWSKSIECCGVSIMCTATNVNLFLAVTTSAIYLSGDGNLEMSVKEFERILKPGGVLISVSGVVPEELRREIFADWNWIRDGSADLQAGCFLLSLPAE